MMKSFFKKLAFVMALAMVVSMVAPAGSAFAATTGVAYQTSKEVVTAYEFAKAGDQVDFCFLGAPADWKSTFKWETSDPAVATVDKAGIVTAVAAGTATITITAGADASYKETVVVTVPAAIEFTAAQKNTTDVVLTFPEGTDLSAVVEDDFVVTAIDETFEYTLFANEVKVDKNVATLNFVDGVLSDGAVLKIAYQTAEATLVASNGDAVSATIKYGMNSKKLAGDAYVYTDLDPDAVFLAYTLYDANGIDVTANYDEDDFDNFEWSVVNGDDIASIDYDNDKEMDTVVFEEKGAATVKLAITFVDEDGEETVIATQAPIVAKNRPAIAYPTFTKAGLFAPDWQENIRAALASFNRADGTVWQSWHVQDTLTEGDTRWFGASLVDNRGKAVTSTKLSMNDALFVEGSTENDYGYFVYSSSNDSVLDIDDDGFVTAIKPGSATILVSFVAVTEEGDELPAKKVGSKRITVAAKSYPASYALTVDTTTVTSTGASVGGSVYLQIFDQFGNAMKDDAKGYGDDFQITATSDNYDSITASASTYTSDIWWLGIGQAYTIGFRGDDFDGLVKANKYGTFKFDVELDKDASEDYEKIKTKSDRAYVKVYNVDEYFEDLNAFYAGADVDVNKNYRVWVDGASRNVWTDVRSEFGDWNTGWKNPKKFSDIGVDLYSAAGLKLMSLPSAYYQELPKVNGKYINIKDMTNASAGAIYYTVSFPTKNADNQAFRTGTNFTFNSVSGGALKTADLGDYTVTLYSVNSRGKLVKLDTKAINVYSTMPKVTYEGFKDGNVADVEVTQNNIKTVLADLCEFQWNGVKLSDDDANFEIAEVRGTDAEGKFRVTEIDFTIRAYNDEQHDWNTRTTTYDWVDYTFTLKRNITIYDGE